ncbi:MAG TPA: 16S rRNA (cytidine(1402)-2'-O)-methyltransferase [Peptococcaceae bacterium]|nr:16S rRNA (cytidine(1402)-2'-O)-methyltransferase [Peptococcaceae bacterium]HQD53888.1 16S rRNA (cytidine(1402)-2'-O)-methyltransferase [Peptococcaceae bacterium]
MGKGDNKAGMLFLVGTPIGNLKDITLRALEVLQEVDLIAAEDTRQTRKLLNHYNIHKPITSYFEHNKVFKGAYLLGELRQGKNIALVSDAGMPGISDPGADVVRLCIEQNIMVTVVPGPSAVLTALVASGLDCNGFLFAGFFPRTKKEKKQLWEELGREKRTLIFYESPHRLVQTLGDLLEVWGDRNCCVARELTKVFEEYRRGRLSEVREYYQDRAVKGEVVLLVEGASQENASGQSSADRTPEEIERCYNALLEQGYERKAALKEAARMLRLPKREVYQVLVEKRKNNEEE